MRHPDTTYRGERITLRDAYGETQLGVRVTVNGRRLSAAPSLKVAAHNEAGFEWGYRGAGATQLALAILLDATGDLRIARAAYVWFRSAVVADWGEEWAITVREIRRWLDQWARESESADVPTVVVGCYAVRRCRVCGCTDADCRQCVAASGVPCSWVAGELDLCSRCADDEDRAVVAGYRPAATNAEGGGS